MVEVDKTITFIQFDLPKLKAGEYTVHASLSAGPKAAPVAYTANRGFAVSGLRFKLGGDDLVSVFPPPLANGEFRGVLPHAVLSRPVLPWLRTCVGGAENESIPWLAVLTVEDGEVAAGPTGPVTAMTAADLIKGGQAIEVAGAAPLPAGTVGKLPDKTVSYPGLEKLDYGESPSDPVNVIDLPVALFCRIAPTAADLALLANIRKTDTHDSVDTKDTTVTRAIVLGNRVGRVGAQATALLVSLENLGSYLPDDDGAVKPIFGDAEKIRLTVLSSWRFFVTDGDKTLEHLLENFNTGSNATVRMPGAAVDDVKVRQATDAQATGLNSGDADALVANAVADGYVPLDHHLRQAGDTVSWYRGPLLPVAGAKSYPLPQVDRPDALLRYDPQLGMFDTSYAAAWQLGQLMGLQSRAYSVALFQWKKQVDKAAAVAEELTLLQTKLSPESPDLGDTPMLAFLDRFTRMSEPPANPPPQVVVDFIAGLRLLNGVPFGYLVPDERMLPPESMRIFTLDPNWIEALVDGAFSIGRTSSAQLKKDRALAAAVHPRSIVAARARRRNDRPHLAAKKAAAAPSFQAITGVLIRSAAIRGWPKLQIDGYSAADDSQPPDVAKLRMVHLSRDLLLCLFDGGVRMIAIHEPPEQLHSGIEFDDDGTAWTTLRSVVPPKPGLQFPEDPKTHGGLAQVLLREGGQVIRAAAAGAEIHKQLKAQFNEDAGTVTANEFALEMVKGAVRVEYLVGSGQ